MPRDVITVVNGGWLPTPVACRAPRNALMRGAKRSLSQPAIVSFEPMSACSSPIESKWPSAVFAPQLVGLRMKPARSIFTVSVRIASGIPSCSGGIGSLTTCRPPSGRSCSRAPTITTPASTGPSLAGTLTDRPAGSPGTFGLVRNTWPGSDGGCVPDPSIETTLPSLLDAGQLPAAALESEHCTSPLSARLPTSPAGRSYVMRPTGMLRSGRLATSVKSGEAPACVLETAVDIDGWKIRWHGAPLPSHEIAKLPDEGCAALPDHGVVIALAVCVPHSVGETSADCGPPWKVSLKSVNAICGSRSKTVVTWPVVKLGCTCAETLMCAP